MPSVLAAVHHPPTLDDLATSDATQRMTRMKVAIQQGHGTLSTYASFMGATNPFYVFVAPEYYFVKSSTGGNNEVWTLHTPDEKKRIFEELRALSSRYKRFLLAPGTVRGASRAEWRRARERMMAGTRRRFSTKAS